MTRIVRIPKTLQEVHGEEASVISLIMVYLASVLLGTTLFLLTPDLHPSWHRWLLAIIALDIGGGVVANMTTGTSEYYRKRPKLRPIFIMVHVIHPLLLWLIFPGQMAIPVVGAATLIFTAIVNKIPEVSNQRMAGALFTVTNLILLLWLKAEAIPTILMTLFSLKLITGFAVRG